MLREHEMRELPWCIEVYFVFLWVSVSLLLTAVTEAAPEVSNSGNMCCKPVTQLTTSPIECEKKQSARVETGGRGWCPLLDAKLAMGRSRDQFCGNARG